MSDSATHDDPESHEGFIRTPKQLIVVVVAAFVLPVIINPAMYIVAILAGVIVTAVAINTLKTVWKPAESAAS